MIVGVSGHQVIPEGATDYIIAAVRSELRDCRGLHGLSSLAAGADQVFAREVVRCGGSLHAIIPCRGYSQTFQTDESRLVYEELLSRAVEVEQLEYDHPSESAFYRAGQRIVDRCSLLLAIWDGLPARSTGGTGDVVAYALAKGISVAIIWPPGVRRN